MTSQSTGLRLACSSHELRQTRFYIEYIRTSKKVEEADLEIQETLQIILTVYEKANINAKCKIYQDRKGDLQK